MAPSLASLSTLALAVAGQVSATKKYQIKATIDKDNFLDRFDFFTSDFTTGNYNDVDPTGGYVNYRSKAEAIAMELYQVKDNCVVLKGNSDDTYNPLGMGRDSVRVESKDAVEKGLMIVRFAHLPKPTCGVWPAMWTYNDPWPHVGEIDIIEQWNDATWNQPAIHTGHSAANGTCRLEQSGMEATVRTWDCDNFSPENYENQGCTAGDFSGPYGSPEGGIYAVEWTDDFIKIFDFTWGNAPADVDADHPDTSTWGTPSVVVKDSKCDIDNHFAAQKLVFNVDFCGVAGIDSIWGESCKQSTGYDTCTEWVATNPDEFKDSYFKIKDILVYEMTESDDTTTTSSTSTTETSTTTTSETSTTSTSTSETSSETSETTSTSSSTYCHDCSASETSTETTETTTSATSTYCHDCSASETSAETTYTTGETTSTSETYSHSETETSRSHGGHDGYTTSTAFTTRTYTVTSCAPEETKCPGKGAVVTETVPLYTTVCPDEEEPEPTKGHGGHGGNDGGHGPKVTSTYTMTNTYTITSCKPIYTDCHVGDVTTEVVTTTYCPEDEEDMEEPTTYTTVKSTQSTIKTVPRPKPTYTACEGAGCGYSNGTKPEPTGSVVPSGGCVGEGCGGPVEVSGGMRAGVGLGVVGVAVLCAFIL